MSFTKLTFGRDWTKETDFPTYQDSEEQVRADLQYHPDAVKSFINDTLLPALEAKSAAAELGAVNGEGAAATVQSLLDEHADTLAKLKQDLQTLAGGGVPSVVQSSTVTFSEDSWATVGGAAMLTIPKSDHKRENGSFGYNIYQLVGDVYRSGTWGAMATRVTYSAGSITLTADEAYSGKVVFFGM